MQKALVNELVRILIPYVSDHVSQSFFHATRYIIIFMLLAYVINVGLLGQCMLILN